MKIVFLVAALTSGGSERTVAYLSEYLSNNGHDVTVLTLSNDIFYSINSKVRVKSLGVPSNYSSKLQRIINIAKRYVGVNAYLLKEKPDVVFCMISEMAKYILINYKIRKFKLITSERGNPQFLSEDRIEQIKRIFRNSDGVIFQTERAKKFHDTDIQERSIVIPNAVGNILVYKVRKINQRLKKFSAMGRLVDQKDYLTMIDAFAMVHEQYPEYSLEIYGVGPDVKIIEHKIASYGLGDSIHLIGEDKEAIIKVANSTAYIMSSKFEGMPNSLMEAMAVGLPCISTDCPFGPAELIKDKYNGLLVPVGDSRSLAYSMKYIIENPDIAEQFGKNAKKILDTNSIDAIAKRYMTYLEMVCIHQK